MIILIKKKNEGRDYQSDNELKRKKEKKKKIVGAFFAIKVN